MTIDWQSSRVQRLDDPLLDYQADHESAEAEFYDRLRKALAELPDPPWWFRVQFRVGDCAYRVRRLFKP